MLFGSVLSQAFGALTKMESHDHEALNVLTKMGVSKNRGKTPQIIHFNRVFHYKPSILGYHYFWKHPNVVSKCVISFPSFCYRGSKTSSPPGWAYAGIFFFWGGGGWRDGG